MFKPPMRGDVERRDQSNLAGACKRRFAPRGNLSGNGGGILRRRPLCEGRTVILRPHPQIDPGWSATC